jgi:hypothetical protein
MSMPPERLLMPYLTVTAGLIFWMYANLTGNVTVWIPVGAVFVIAGIERLARMLRDELAIESPITLSPDSWPLL